MTRLSHTVELIFTSIWISALVIVYLAIFIELVNFYLAFQFQFVKSVLDDYNI